MSKCRKCGRTLTRLESLAEEERRILAEKPTCSCSPLIVAQVTEDVLLAEKTSGDILFGIGHSDGAISMDETGRYLSVGQSGIYRFEIVGSLRVIGRLESLQLQVVVDDLRDSLREFSTTTTAPSQDGEGRVSLFAVTLLPLRAGQRACLRVSVFCSKGRGEGEATVERGTRLIVSRLA